MRPQNQTQLLGHRGARGEILENTFAGFQYAQQLSCQGLTGVEFDVQLSADGHLVVFHDDDLVRLCHQQSRIDQLSLAQMRRYRQFGHPIICLASMAPILTGFSHIELEIKTHSRTNYAKLIHALCQYLTEGSLARLPIVLTSFDTVLHAHIQRHRSLLPLPRGLLIDTPKTLRTATVTAQRLGCCQLGIYHPLISRTVVDHNHRYGLSISAWTVNDGDTIDRLMAWHTDVIITDFPQRFLTSDRFSQ